MRDRNGVSVTTDDGNNSASRWTGRAIRAVLMMGGRGMGGGPIGTTQ